MIRRCNALVVLLATTVSATSDLERIQHKYQALVGDSVVAAFGDFMGTPFQPIDMSFATISKSYIDLFGDSALDFGAREESVHTILATTWFSFSLRGCVCRGCVCDRPARGAGSAMDDANHMLYHQMITTGFQLDMIYAGMETGHFCTSKSHPGARGLLRGLLRGQRGLQTARAARITRTSLACSYHPLRSFSFAAGGYFNTGSMTYRAPGRSTPSQMPWAPYEFAEINNLVDNCPKGGEYPMDGCPYGEGTAPIADECACLPLPNVQD